MRPEARNGEFYFLGGFLLNTGLFGCISIPRDDAKDFGILDATVLVSEYF